MPRLSRRCDAGPQRDLPLKAIPEIKIGTEAKQSPFQVAAGSFAKIKVTPPWVAKKKRENS
jgi:hypothetical protein